MEKLVAEIHPHPEYFCMYQNNAFSAKWMINYLAERNAVANGISVCDLGLILLAKGVQFREWDLNGFVNIEKFTREVFQNRDNVEIAINQLDALPGVGVQTASAILSWVFPNEFPVLDIHVKAALAHFGVEGVENIHFTAVGYVAYCNIVLNISRETDEIPQRIDCWLYSYSRFNHLLNGLAQ